MPLQPFHISHRIHHTVDLGVICKLHELVDDSAVDIVDEDEEEYRTEHRALWDAT